MSPHVDAPAYLTSLAGDLAVLAAVGVADLDRPVPSCPGWSMAHLVGHLGRIQRWVLASLDSPGDGEPPAFPPRPPVDHDALVEWFSEGGDALLRALRLADLDAVHPTFAGPRPAAWWLRRQTFEHAVHRWDAEQALGRDPRPVELAADGVDEWIELQGQRGWQAPDDLRGSIHLHGTDGDGEWLIDVAGSMTVTRGHHKGDAAVRGPLSDLYLMLWGRVGADRLEVIGDAELVERFLAAG